MQQELLDWVCVCAGVDAGWLAGWLAGWKLVQEKREK